MELITSVAYMVVADMGKNERPRSLWFLPPVASLTKTSIFECFECV